MARTIRETLNGTIENIKSMLPNDSETRLYDRHAQILSQPVRQANPPHQVVTFSPKVLGRLLPKGCELIPELHHRAGSDVVPYLVDLGKTKAISRNGKRVTLAVGKETPIGRKGIDTLEMVPKNYDEYRSNDIHPYFFIIKTPENKVIGSELVPRKSGITTPEVVHWPSVSSGISKVEDTPDEFGKNVKKFISGLGEGSNVLVVGSAFGLPLIELHERYPKLNFVGIDAKNWAQALPAMGDKIPEGQARYARHSTVIAEACPDAVNGFHETPFGHYEMPTAKNVPFKNRSFHAILVHPNTYKYFSDPVGFFKEGFRILKDGGKIIGDFHGDDRHEFIEKGERIDLKHLLENQFKAEVDRKYLTDPLMDALAGLSNQYLEISKATAQPNLRSREAMVDKNAKWSCYTSNGKGVTSRYRF